MATSDGRSYAQMSEEDLLFEQSMQHIMLESLEGTPGNISTRKSEIQSHLRQIGRALNTISSRSNSRTDSSRIPSASQSATNANRHGPRQLGLSTTSHMSHHGGADPRGSVKRTFETNVRRHSPPRPSKVFRPSPSSSSAVFDSPSVNSNSGYRRGNSSSSTFIDLTDDPDVLKVQEAEVERFRKRKQQEHADAEIARRLQYEESASPEPGPSSRQDSSPPGWSGTELPSASLHDIPGSFDDNIGSLFGDDNLFGDDSLFGSYSTSPMGTPSASDTNTPPQAYIGGSSSSNSVPFHVHSAPLPASERARQAALQRQGQRLSNPGMSLGGRSSFTLESQGLQRPGSLVNGSANPLQHVSATSNSYAHPNSKASLKDIINRTAGYDYTNGTDGSGNPLDLRVIDLVYNRNDSPSQEEGIERLLANVNSDTESPTDEHEEADPEGLVYPLYKHQRQALRWMTRLERDDHKKGGILADEMGLGKTISALALMVSRPAQPAEGETYIRAKTTLIVAPLSVLYQWEDEIRRKLKPGHRLNVLKYHNSKDGYQTLRTHDVVITTFGTLTSEMGKLDEYLKSEDRPKDHSTLSELFPLLGPNSLWYRVILDEAHNIKNAKTKTAKAVHRLKSEHRWCLSGTPMMNNVSELSSLITFLKIEPYCTPDTFKRAFECLGKSRAPGFQKNDSMRKLQVLLKAIMLRRKKDSEIDGQPIVKLPPKTVEQVHVVFDDDQATYYNDLEKHSQVQLSKYLKEGAIGKKYAAVLTLLLRLRQACCHPYLHITDLEYGGNSEVAEDIMIQLAQTMDPKVIERLKDNILDEGEENFKCPLCEDVGVNILFTLPCGHCLCTEDLARTIDFASRAGQNPTCAHCRGPLDPQKTVTFDVFKKIHLPHLVKEEYETDSDYDSDLDEDGFKGDDIDSKGNLKDFIVSDNDLDSSDIDEDLRPAYRKKRGATKKEPESDSEFEDMSKTVQSKAGPGGKDHDKKQKKLRHKGKKAAPIKLQMLGQLRKEAKRNKAAHKRYMQGLRSNWEPSAKVTKCEELIRDIQATGEKTIVFSQWTLLLDLIEVRLKHELGIKYRRYDGGMSHNMRVTAAKDFADDSEIKVILVSLKAGNAGLNLNAASQVIIMDPHWNPSLELQAIDRAHRIGQQKPVQVHRILVKETVEDRIMQLQEDKRQVVEGALDDTARKEISGLGITDLRFLFGLGGRGPGR